MDRDRWADLYGKLAQAFNKPLNPAQATVYYEALEELPDWRVDHAVTKLIRTSPHFPAVAAIRDHVAEQQAEEWRQAQSQRRDYTVRDPLTPEQQEDFRQRLQAVKAKLGMP